MIAYENRCNRCSYSFEGLGAGPVVCPECGESYSEVTAHPRPADLAPMPADGWRYVNIVAGSTIALTILQRWIPFEWLLLLHSGICAWAGYRTAPLFFDPLPRRGLRRLCASVILAVFLAVATFGTIAVTLGIVMFAVRELTTSRT